MSAPADALARLVRAADAALRRLCRALAGRLRRALLRGGATTPGRLALLGGITLAGVRALVGASPGAMFPRDGGRPAAPLARLVRAVVRAAVGLATPDAASRARGWDEARRWVDPAGRTLARRLWRDADLLRRRIDREVERGLRAGVEPEALARRVEALLLGEPGDDGRGAFRRLFHTEASRAHGLAVIQAAGEAGRLVRWRVSGRHVRADECDAHARRDVGHGGGVYPAGGVPRFPAHPWCRCSLVLV